MLEVLYYVSAINISPDTVFLVRTVATNTLIRCACQGSRGAVRVAPTQAESHCGAQRAACSLLSIAEVLRMEQPAVGCRQGISHSCPQSCTAQFRVNRRVALGLTSET